MPGGRATMEPCAQVTIITVGTVYTALATLSRWMLKPRNRGKPKNPLNGAPFLETLAECVEDPVGYEDECKDVRLRVVAAHALSRADGLVGKVSTRTLALPLLYVMAY